MHAASSVTALAAVCKPPLPLRWPIWELVPRAAVLQQFGPAARLRSLAAA